MTQKQPHDIDFSTLVSNNIENSELFDEPFIGQINQNINQEQYASFRHVIQQKIFFYSNLHKASGLINHKNTVFFPPFIISCISLGYFFLLFLLNNIISYKPVIFSAMESFSITAGFLMFFYYLINNCLFTCFNLGSSNNFDFFNIQKIYNISEKDIISTITYSGNHKSTTFLKENKKEGIIHKILYKILPNYHFKYNKKLLNFFKDSSEEIAYFAPHDYLSKNTQNKMTLDDISTFKSILQEIRTKKPLFNLLKMSIVAKISKISSSTTLAIFFSIPLYFIYQFTLPEKFFSNYQLLTLFTLGLVIFMINNFSHVINYINQETVKRYDSTLSLKIHTLVNHHNFINALNVCGLYNEKLIQDYPEGIQVEDFVSIIDSMSEEDILKINQKLHIFENQPISPNENLFFLNKKP